MLKKQYFRMGMKDGTSMKVHIKNMTDRLAAINAPIAEEDQDITLLGSLPPSYSTLVTALEARDASSLSYVQQSLIREKQKINTLHTSSDTMSGTGEALIGKHEYQTSKWYQYKNTCYFCGESGHFSRTVQRVSTKSH